MNATEFVLELMERKAKRIEELTGIPAKYYFNGDDGYVLEQEEWEESALWALGNYYYCPFCYIWSDTCEGCPYGLRHGVCGESGSTYTMLSDDVNSKDTSIITIGREIFQELMKEYNDV